MGRLTATGSVHTTLDAFLVALALALTLLPSVGHAQSHEASADGVVLRASVVPSTLVSPAVARRHDIAPAADRALLNVVLERSSAPVRNVKAQVSAYATDLNGRRRDIPLRPAVDDGQTSYIGIVEFLPNEVLDFVVVAAPDGGSSTIRLAFRERMRGY